MNATIELGTPGDLLDFEEGRHPFRLYPAVAGAQVEVRLRLSRTKQDDGTTFRVASTLYFGNASHSRLRVGPITQTGTVTAAERQRDVVLAGFISNEQLRVAEELRGGGDLWLTPVFQ